MMALHEQLQAALSRKWQLPGFPTALEKNFDVQFAELAALEGRLALSAEGARVTSFFRRFPEPSKLIPVTRKADWKSRR